MSDGKVLIVGAGPSGLMMAHELLRFGIDLRLVDAQVQKPVFSRAIGVQVRTQEIFASLGLLDDLSRHATTLSGIEVYAEGRAPIRIPLMCNFSAFKSVMVVDQPFTEAVLENAVTKLGGKVERGVSVVGLTKTSQGISAQLQNSSGEMSTENFSYVVGADGAHSLVRKSMGVEFSGLTYDDAFILADAECFYKQSQRTFKLFFDRQAFLAVVPMAQKNQHRLISVRRNERSKAGPEPTKEEFEHLAKFLIPFDFTIQKATWVSRFFVSCRSAKTYQEDRLFLVGDAAHIHSPAGGQGMNTGLQDAFNLAFKLALTLKGKAAPKLLESYTQERRPVGEFLLKRTDALFRFMVRSSLWARLMRRTFLPLVAKTPALQRRIFRIGSQVAIRYKSGCICRRQSHENSPELKVGMRLPSLELWDTEQNKLNLHELFLDFSFLNFIYCPYVDAPDLPEAIELCVSHMKQNFDSSIKNILLVTSGKNAQKTRFCGPCYVVDKSCRQLSGIDQPTYFLARPDHHLFCMAPLGEYAHAISSLQDFVRGKS